VLIHDVVNIMVHGMLLLFFNTSKKINRRIEDRKKREKISRFTEAYNENEILRNKNLEINLTKKFCEVTPKNLEIFFLQIYQVYEKKILRYITLKISKSQEL
jgi:hypothetical protein